MQIVAFSLRFLVINKMTVITKAWVGAQLISDWRSSFFLYIGVSAHAPDY